MASDGDSSSSSSSDDELLLNSPPVFSKKRKDGRTERAEKLKLDFFHSCINGTKTRGEVQRRIACVEREEWGEQLQGDGRGVKEEQDDVDEQNVSEEYGGNGFNSGAASAKAVKTEEDGTNDKYNANRVNKVKSEAESGGQPSESGSTKLTKTLKEKSKLTASTITSTTESTTSSTATSVTTTSTTNKQQHGPPQPCQRPQRPLPDANDESYWERVESFAKKQGSGGSNGRGRKRSKTNPNKPQDIHDSRRKLVDSLQYSYNSNYDNSDSETDDEDGKWVNGSSGMTREQKRWEAEAKVTGLQSFLGLRRMFADLEHLEEKRRSKAWANKWNGGGIGARNRSVKGQNGGDDSGKSNVSGKSLVAKTKNEQWDGSLSFYMFDSKLEARNELKAILVLLEKKLEIPLGKSGTRSTKSKMLSKSAKSNQCHNLSDESHLILKQQFIDPLNSIVKKAENFVDSMNLFLRFNPVIRCVAGAAAAAEWKTKNENDYQNSDKGNMRSSDIKSDNWTNSVAVMVPELFCQWLWKVACSSFHILGHLTTTSCHLLVKYLKDEKDSRKDSTKEDVSGAELAFLKQFQMEQILQCLENDFGLWMQPGPMSPSFMNPKSLQHAQQPSLTDEDAVEGGRMSKKALKHLDKSTLDVKGLKNLFLLLRALLDRDFISLEGSMRSEVQRGVEANGEAVGQDLGQNEAANDSLLWEGATKVLVALTKCSLDPCLYPDMRYSNGCAQTSPDLIQELKSSLVKSVARQISDRHDEKQVEEWMKETAEQMVDACSNLSSGEEGTTDSDDIGGHLPLATAVLNMVSCDPLSIDVSVMKMHFAVRALQSSLSEIIDWDERVKAKIHVYCQESNNNNKNEEVISLSKELLQCAIHALVSAEVAMQWMNDEGEEFIMQEKSHFLAAVQICGECTAIGSVLFHHCYNDETRDSPVYTTEEKDAIFETMANLEDLCHGLKKECRGVIAYPHLRRAKEYLTRWGKTLGGTRGHSSKDKRKKMREQGSLDSWIGRASINAHSPLT